MVSAKKYCALGAMPTPLVADCLDLLLPVITHLINSSLTAGYFPSAWKEALITPLLKKAVLEPLFSNLRPISLRFFYVDWTRCLWSNLWLFDCVWTAPWVTICLQEALWHRNGTFKCAKWYSSEYGSSVDHHVLLSRVETTFGITGRALAWFHSYQPNRSQRVAFGYGISDNFRLTCGVPQGSCLGPISSPSMLTSCSRSLRSIRLLPMRMLMIRSLFIF